MFNLFKNLRNKGYKRRLQNPRDEYYDRVFRIKTFAYKKYSDDWYDPVWKGDYMPSKYKDILVILKTANVDNSSIVVDFGCGLGRVVFAAAHLGAKRSIGVEFDEELFHAAESNRLTSKFPDKVSFFHLDASVYQIPNDANVFFFFNPFGSAIMSDVMKNIETSLKIAPRKVCIIYYNPMFTDDLKSSEVFKLQEEWPAKRVEYVVQFWRN